MTATDGIYVACNVDYKKYFDKVRNAKTAELIHKKKFIIFGSNSTCGAKGDKEKNKYTFVSVMATHRSGARLHTWQNCHIFILNYFVYSESSQVCLGFIFFNKLLYFHPFQYCCWRFNGTEGKHSNSSTTSTKQKVEFHPEIWQVIKVIFLVFTNFADSCGVLLNMIGFTKMIFWKNSERDESERKI